MPHYYTREGKPRHTVPLKDGSGERDTTVADARREKLVPSATTVEGIVAKPQLTNWLMRGVAEVARYVSPDTNETPGAYAARVLALYEEQSEERTGSAVGDAIHNSIESLFLTGECGDEYRHHAEAAAAEVEGLFPGVDDWVPEKTFAHPLGYGGMVDLHSPSMGIVADFKTKDFDLSGGNTVRPGTDNKYRLDYDQYVQLAAYQRGLFGGLPGTAAANIFVSRSNPGVVTSKVWSIDKLKEGWKKFEAMLRLWALLKNYDPSWEQ